MDILICEDDKNHRNLIELIITKYLTKNDIAINLALSATNPYQLIKYLENNKTSQALYFLDVDLQSDMNGFELANKIRDIDLAAKIVFITNHVELTSLTFSYKIEALDFIVKDKLEHMNLKIIDCINVACERYKLSSHLKEVILLETVNETLRVEAEDILFIETSPTPHKIIYHLKDSSIEVYGKIKNIESLSNDFLRCHQSFVVNIKNITSIDRKNKIVHLRANSKCFVSKRYLSKLLEKCSVI